MPNCENIKLEKDMYKVKGGLTEALEALDPSMYYKGTAFEGLDAFSRQLKRFDIKTHGKDSDCVEKFFQNSNTAVLFPEYVRRAVIQGIEKTDVLSKIVATVTNTDETDYNSITHCDKNDRLIENPVKLYTHGKTLSTTYETLRFQRLDIVTVIFRQLGMHIATAQLKDALDVITDNAEIASAINTDIQSANLCNNISALRTLIAPYKLNVILISVLSSQIMNDLHQFKNADNEISPFGAKVITTSELKSNELIGLDKNYALEMVQSGGVTVDYNNLIDRQFQNAQITCTAGFSTIFNNAMKMVV